MRGWLSYSAAFGLALASAIGGYFAGFMIIMSGVGYGIAAFFAITILVPLMVGFGVFVISYAAFHDQWIGWSNSLIAGAFIFGTTVFCFTLMTQEVVSQVSAAVLLVLILFFGGRFLLKRGSLV